MIANISRYAAYAIGATALVIGSFVTISALAGTPANEMKAVGGLFPESVTAENEGAGNADGETPEEERESDIRSPRQVFESATTPLGAFALQDPFSAEELRELERQLQVKIDELARRHRALEEREREVEADRQHYLDQFAQFERLRTALLEQRDENDANAEEIDRAPLRSTRNRPRSTAVSRSSSRRRRPGTPPRCSPRPTRPTRRPGSWSTSTWTVSARS